MSAKVVALCGGVGGAKLAVGLAQVIPAQELTIIVNTGDDFTHLGLHVSPDVDTVLYSLSGLADSVRGWGLDGETWGFMRALKRLGGEDWFLLGDADLATHILRTLRLRAGDTLEAITRDFAQVLGVNSSVVPMSNASVRTVLDTVQGRLTFQDYFVRHRAEPVVKGISYHGADTAPLSPLASAALQDPALELIVLCPSNPWLSLAPMLAMPELRALLQTRSCPVVSVSPLIAGAAVKGPTAKLMRELSLDVCAKSVADYYGWLVDGHVLDVSHAHEMDALRTDGFQVLSTPTLMTDLWSKADLAEKVLMFGQGLMVERQRAGSGARRSALPQDESSQ